MIDALADAAGTEPHFVPRIETAFEIHALSTTALTGGAFDVAITAVPRPGSSMAGRFAHLLTPDEQEALADGYCTDPDALTAQLSFAPRRRRTENVIRTPRLLPHVIAVGEHPAADGQAIDLAELRRGARLRLGRVGMAVRLVGDHRIAARSETSPAMARWVSS